MPRSSDCSTLALEQMVSDPRVLVGDVACLSSSLPSGRPRLRRSLPTPKARFPGPTGATNSRSRDGIRRAKPTAGPRPTATAASPADEPRSTLNRRTPLTITDCSIFSSNGPSTRHFDPTDRRHARLDTYQREFRYRTPAETFCGRSVWEASSAAGAERRRPPRARRWRGRAPGRWGSLRGCGLGLR